MALAAELSRAKTPPERLSVRATVVLGQSEEKGFHIAESALVVRARVPGATGPGFEAAARAADASCPYSKLIRASGEVRLDAELEG
jgi:osmotically inducible protein OsmC